MKVNGEAIYGTRANPFNEEFQWGRVTRKGNDKFYLIVYKKPSDGKIVLPCTFSKVKASMLNDKTKLNIIKYQKDGYTVIDVSSVSLDGPATVVKLEGKLKMLNK